ncbi:hypothetical protein AVEN_152313-1 [Araneus ventricosus]|uniref:Uncharacterized protein n=1 Tax=Araneus ventricosus TaxID=182803 RepID=A0A4Y2RZ52_ARAVE|nr:hypothetical protein AVEN_152313-1 [Araneus ventricosus]
MRFSQYITADLGNLQKRSFMALQKCYSVTYFYHILCLTEGLRDPKDQGWKPESCKSAAYLSPLWAMNRIWKIRNPPAGLVWKFGEAMLTQSSSSDCRKKL